MITEETVEQIREKLLAAEKAVEEAGALLCNEPGNTPGGEVWKILTYKVDNGIAECIHSLHEVRRINTDPLNMHMRGR